MMDLAIIPECFVDTNLIETIVPSQQYNHQKGCGTVTKVMKEKFANSFAVGIIDKDKKEVDYLNEFLEVTKSNSLFLYKHPAKHHYIIQIHPAIETFILSEANNSGLKVSDYNLPTELHRFAKAAKTILSKKDQRFKQLFKTLLQNDAPEIKRLSAWISYLKEARYAADIEVLKRI
ncbi:hypothetical protein [Niabella aquatica]